ncbi:MAG: O-antigen ligase family protein, partial [Bacteroidales bacterium]|nr:O-antigen ligase family protein [Bacteroidales bacterium]
LFILNSLTGYFVFFSIVLINVIYVLIKIKINKFKILIISILMLFILIPVVYTISIINDFYKFEKVDFKNLEKITISGNNYYHNLKSKRKENGNIIDIYICKKELEQEWNKKSELKFNNLDKKNQQLSETIIRYLSSKGLRKDSSGISKLTKKEIKYIENGCANYLYINKFSIKSRIYHIIWQIDTFIKTGNATGQSISQRVEFYKSSISLIKKNFWFGVGTGDVMDESKKELSMISSLEKGYRNRVHNQFLVVFTGLGLFGFILFFVFLFYPVLKYKLLNNYLFLNFFTIVLVSFFSVNTLETQLGVSFFSFFYTLLFYNKEKFEKAIF